jgi:hypothetical protein
MQRVGYAYWKNGFKDSVDYYFNKQIRYFNDAIRLIRTGYQMQQDKCKKCSPSFLSRTFKLLF